MRQLRLTISLCLIVFVLVGCEGKQDSYRARLLQSRDPALQRNGVNEAMSYLPLLMRLDRSAAVKEVVLQLNSWSNNFKDNGQWHASPLVQSYRADTATAPLVQSLGQISYGEVEGEYLLQCRLMKDVNTWVTAADYHDELFADWLREAGAKLETSDRRMLEATLKLFDWTVRNVAIDAPPQQAETLLDDSQLPLADNAIGYTQLPWQTMIFGRGDAWQRARVFTQLLQQSDIISCVLAIPDADSQAPLKLWSIGVPIAGEVYLFEPTWGLPIPGPGEKGVATLRQAKEDASVLRRGNLPGQFEYPIDSDDLKDVVALIDLEPMALGHSMAALEPELSGKNRLEIFVDPSKTVQRLNDAVGANNVRLWSLPVMAQYYNSSVRLRLFDQSPFSLNYLANYGPFFTDTLINTARRDHFEGKFEKTLDHNGALKNYMTIRIDDATLDELTTNTVIQEQMEIKQGGNESRESFVARLEQYKTFYKVAKFHTSTFLGMAQFDLGNYAAAIDWLDERTLQVAGTTMWHPTAEYVLARCYEAMNQPEKAIDYLKREGRPQEAGNRIRARLIQARMSTPTKSE